MKEIQSHIKRAHVYWQQVVSQGDHVIDATAGNGHDSLFLAQLCLLEGKGKLIIIDKQKQALIETKKKMQEALSPSSYSRIEFHLQSHETLPQILIPPKLIVYNLGYLPGGDHLITTTYDSTLKSVECGLQILQENGYMSITCYPGHKEGQIEQTHLLKFLQTLSSKKYTICHHTWINRPLAPNLFWIHKKLK